jgi:hypothetical protein
VREGLLTMRLVCATLTTEFERCRRAPALARDAQGSHEDKVRDD